MELHDENSFKIRSYSNAAIKLERLSKPLKEHTPDEIEAIDGVGKSMAAFIGNLINKGQAPYLQELLDKTPLGIQEMMTLKGIGPKKIRTLWQTLGIEDNATLLEACQADKVAAIKGFGAKTQQKLIEILKFNNANKGKMRYAEAEPFVALITQTLQQIFPNKVWNVCGDIRRKNPVVEKITIIGDNSIPAADLQKAMESLHFLSMNEPKSGPCSWRGAVAAHALTVEVILLNPADITKQLLLHSAGKAHLSAVVHEGKTVYQLLESAHFNDEISFFEHIAHQFIPPEMREGQGEWEMAKEYKIPELLKIDDLKGILHNHSTYSDGKDTLEEMAKHCQSLGFEYLGMSDHSKSAFYANGLYENVVKKQQEEIDALNEKLAPFKIFKGIESDILADGSLDYADNVLSTFDFIVASIHGNLNMDINKATNRLLKAIENPYTTMLGHPTGRLILMREGYPIDHKKVIDACAKYNVIIEINANPKRLDMDWQWVNYALQQGVKLSINPDAHEKAGYDHMRFGVYMGRKGGLTAAQTFNAMPLDEVEKYFNDRKAAIQS